MTAENTLLNEIRSKFPRAGSDVNGRKRIFLDNAAGSLVLKTVADAEAKVILDYFPNVGATSWESQKNEEVIDEGRKGVQDLLNAKHKESIITGESATALFFHLSYTLGKTMKKTDNVVITEYEHYANVSPWLELERRGVIKEVRFAKFDEETGMLDIDNLGEIADKNTKIISAAGVSNALGSKTPLNQVRKIARENDSLFAVDGVHTIQHIPVDVQELDCDFFVFSGYKLFSRRGSFMYGKKEVLEELSPYKVDPCPDYSPVKWEWGTRDHGLFAGISAVVDYLEWLGTKVEDYTKDKTSKYSGRRKSLKSALTWIQDYETKLTEAMLKGIDDIPGLAQLEDVELYGLNDHKQSHIKSPTFTFNVKNTTPKEICQYIFDKHAVALLGPEDFYSRALQTYNTKVASRASLCHFNTFDEVKIFLNGIKDTVNHFK